jgi:hypothetical protein
MEHRVSHDIGRELAKKAAKAAFSAYAAKYAEYKPTTTWTGDDTATVSFNVKGFSVKGNVEVREREILIDIDVPFLLKAFKSMALEIIEREMRIWVDKAKRGELE